MWKAAMVWMIALLLTAQEETSSREEKGQSQAPLSLSLRVDKPRCVVGEFFFVYITIRNNGPEEIYLPWITTDSVAMGEYIFFDIEDQGKKKIEIRRFGTGATPIEVVRHLKPKEEFIYYFTLADTHRMANVGTYTVKARLAFNPRVPVETEDRKKVDNYWKGELLSNVVTVTVDEPQGVDSEVCKIVVNHDEKILHPPDFGSLYGKYPKSQYFKYWAFLHAEMLADNLDKPAPDHKKALTWYQKVVADYEVFEFTDDAELAIARIYRLQGKKEEAIQQVRRVLELYPNTDSVSGAKKLLKELQSK